MRRLLPVLLALAGVLIAAPGLLAQPAEPEPQELRALAELLRDPAIQAWLQAQADRARAEATPAAADGGATAHQMMAGRVGAMRAFPGELAAAARPLPAEIALAPALLAAGAAGDGRGRPVALPGGCA